MQFHAGRWQVSSIPFWKLWTTPFPKSTGSILLSLSDPALSNWLAVLSSRRWRGHGDTDWFLQLRLKVLKQNRLVAKRKKCYLEQAMVPYQLLTTWHCVSVCPCKVCTIQNLPCWNDSFRAWQTWACLLPAFQQTWRNTVNTARPQAAVKSEGDRSDKGCRQDEGRQVPLLNGNRSLSHT